MNLPEVGRRETIPRPETNRSVLSVLSEGKTLLSVLSWHRLSSAICSWKGGRKWKSQALPAVTGVEIPT